MAFCPQCGKQMSDDARFCPACGATATAAAQGTGGAPPPPQEPPAGASPATPPVTPPAAPIAQPPPGAPPAHVPGVVPPPPRKQKTGKGWKLALVIILVVLLVIGAGVAVLAVFVFKAVKAPVDTTNNYIAAINEGDAEEAWELLHPSSRFRRDYTYSTFETTLVEPSINSVSTWNANEVEVSGSRAVVGVDIEFADGTDSKVSFTLKKDNGDWLISDYVY